MQDVTSSVFAILMVAAFAVDMVERLPKRRRLVISLSLMLAALATIIWPVYLPVSRALADFLSWAILCLIGGLFLISLPGLIVSIKAAARE
jgi:MFS family permease